MFSNTLFHLRSRVDIPSAYEDETGCPETSAYKIQKPGNYPEESIQQIIPFYRYSCVPVWAETHHFLIPLSG